MSHRELMDWLRFEAATSPLPDRLADLHFGIVSSLIVNAMWSSASEPASPADFLVIREPPRLEPGTEGASEAERAAATWRGGS